METSCNEDEYIFQSYIPDYIKSPLRSHMRRPSSTTWVIMYIQATSFIILATSSCTSWPPPPVPPCRLNLNLLATSSCISLQPPPVAPYHLLLYFLGTYSCTSLQIHPLPPCHLLMYLLATSSNILYLLATSSCTSLPSSSVPPHNLILRLLASYFCTYQRYPLVRPGHFLMYLLTTSSIFIYRLATSWPTPTSPVTPGPNLLDLLVSSSYTSWSSPPVPPGHLYIFLYLLATFSSCTS